MPAPAEACKLCVLIVEDELLIRMGTGSTLEDAGFTVIEAGDAEEAIGILEQQAEVISVVFTDVQMPGLMDGVALAHHTRQHWPWIGLLIVSAKAVHTLGELPLGCRFLSKPYDPEHVVRHVACLAPSSVIGARPPAAS